MSKQIPMAKKSKEVQGLLFKVAELETLVIVLIGMLDAKGTLTKEEIEAIFGMAEIPEILGARIKRIEEQGSVLIEARKRLLSELLDLNAALTEEDAPDADLLEETPVAKDPDKKLH